MKSIQSKAAEVDPSVIHPVDYTYNSVSAQILPSIIREYVGMRKENETFLRTGLAEYRRELSPRMSGSSTKFIRPLIQKEITCHALIVLKQRLRERWAVI